METKAFKMFFFSPGPFLVFFFSTRFFFIVLVENFLVIESGGAIPFIFVFDIVTQLSRVQVELLTLLL